MDANDEFLSVETRTLADAIAASGSLEPIYAFLDDAILDWDKHAKRPEDFLPANSEPGLGFAFRDRRDGRNFWQTIVYTTRDSVCEEDGELRKIATSPVQTGAGSFAGEIMHTFGLSPEAAPIAVALAAAILIIGVRSFCTWSLEESDEPEAP